MENLKEKELWCQYFLTNFSKHYTTDFFRVLCSSCFELICEGEGICDEIPKKKKHMVKNHEDAYRLKICHFLLLNILITEVRKTKMMGKSGIFPCQGSTVKQFLFYKVLTKNT